MLQVGVSSIAKPGSNGPDKNLRLPAEWLAAFGGQG
jgi:hypothetical protein